MNVIVNCFNLTGFGITQGDIVLRFARGKRHPRCGRYYLGSWDPGFKNNTQKKQAEYQHASICFLNTSAL